jgi:hypothetical protein
MAENNPLGIWLKTTRKQGEWVPLYMRGLTSCQLGPASHGKIEHPHCFTATSGRGKELLNGLNHPGVLFSRITFGRVAL